SVVDSHPDHRDRGMDSGQGPDARDAPAGADDDPAVDLLAQDCVRAADVPCPLRGDRRRLDPEAELAESRRRLEDTFVTGAPPLLQGQVEVAHLDTEPQDVRFEEPQRLSQQLLAGLVAVQDGDGRARHRPESYLSP